MPKKLSLEYVINFYKKYNYEFIDEKYIGKRYKHKIKCFNGHIVEKSIELFERVQYCLECHKDYVKNEFKQNNWILLDEYKDAKTKLKCICPNNHIQFKTPDLFIKSNGKGCIECSGLLKHDIDYIKKIVEEQGCELLETEYINAKTKMKYKCRCGFISYSLFNNIKNGHGCSNCRKINNSGKNNSRWIEDRTKILRLDLLRKSPDQLIKLLIDDPLYKDYIKNSDDFHIDHIFPRKAFIDNNLDIIYGNKIIKEICNSRTNLQILNKYDNMTKGSKYNNKEFLEWINTHNLN